MTSQSTSIHNNPPHKRKLPLSKPSQSTDNPQTNQTPTNPQQTNNNEPSFQFPNIKQKQIIINTPIPENKRYSFSKKKQQQDIKEETNETLQTPHNLYSEPSEDHCHVATIASNNNNNNNNNKQIAINKNNNHKTFVNPFDSVQSSNNIGNSNSNSVSASTNNLLVKRSINNNNKLNFNTSGNNSNNSNNNIFFNKNHKNTNYGTDNNYILEDDINFKLNENNDEDDDNNNNNNNNTDQDNTELINKFNTINYDVFTSESNFHINNNNNNPPNKEHTTTNTTSPNKNIQITLPNITDFITQYPIPHCTLQTAYETNKKLQCIINNSLYEEIQITDLNVIKTKPQYKWLTPSLTEINEHIDKLFYDNLTSMKLFEEHNKLLHKTIIHIKDTYTSYISDLYKYIFNTNLNEDTFTHYRKVVCDDDYSGLFRILIFAYIENCICFNRKENLSTTLYNFISNLNHTEQYISNIIIIKILLEHLNKNQLDLAYQVLINIFVNKTSFVDYIVDYIGQVFKTVFANTNTNSNFFDELLHKMQKENNIEHISQSTVCLIYIFGILFNTSVHIYQPFVNESKVFSISNMKTYMIYLIYDYPVFYIGYPSLLVSLTSYSQKILFSKPDAMVIINTAPICCDVCHNKTVHLIIQEKTQPICKECLVKVINDVIIKKTNLLCDSLYTFPMYYCSRIYIHKELPLLNETTFQLNNNITLQDSIRMNIANQNTCVYCKQQFTIQMKCCALYPCGCLYCKECLRSKITSETNGKVLLNNYEFNISKYNFICNGCSNVINKAKDYYDILSHILNEDELKLLQQEACERLMKDLDMKCCVCGNESKENEMVLNEMKHMLCNKCKDNFAKRSFQHKNEFECLFCNNNNNNKHEYNSLLFSIGKETVEVKQQQDKEKRSKKNSDNKCCIIF